MITVKSKYLGALRTQAQHVRSGEIVLTDAPVDNNGKGEAFSPTDMVCSALTSCMMTIMGIVADREGINLEGLEAETIKEMSADPRKIKKISVTFSWENPVTNEVQLKKIKKAALTCPVALSLDPQIEQDVRFEF
jgi:putative redox protein